MGELAHLNPDLGRAIAESRRVRFFYRGRERDVFPFGVLMRWGHAYLVADEGGHQKSFRTDRIEPPYLLGPLDEHLRPADLRSALPEHPWLLEVDQRVAVMLVGSPAQLASLGATLVGDAPIMTTEGLVLDAQALVYGRVEVSNVGALLSDLLMESYPVIPVAPAEIRERFVQQVRAVWASLDVGLVAGEVQAMNHLDRSKRFTVDRTTTEIAVEEYAAVVLPGGVANPDQLRQDDAAVSFLRRFVESGRPVAVICHGPWTLVEAGVLEGRTLTSWPSLRTDITNAGGTWVDEEVHICTSGPNVLVSSRKPDDLDAFCKAAVDQFAASHSAAGAG